MAKIESGKDGSVMIISESKKYTYEDFLEIIKMLRGENGCPWDRVQTHESLKPCMMEEAAELLASIRIYGQTGNPENMREELGDVLLQVVMHAEIASEEGLFTMEDVVDEVSRKMIRRHPHVFGTCSADNSEEALANWEEIKKEEKKDKEWIVSPLREIPQELPALTRASKVLKRIDKNYKKGNSYVQNVEALQEAVGALKSYDHKPDSRELEKIVGDILICVSDIARIARISQEQVLSDRIEDLIEKYEHALNEL
ncbi:MAG: MazG family protein [Lachnospiraceae bacterium]|nr:MazG family protein [Lachnospiraceae bacterium]